MSGNRERERGGGRENTTISSIESTRLDPARERERAPNSSIKQTKEEEETLRIQFQWVDGEEGMPIRARH